MTLTNRDELIRMGRLISNQRFLPKDLEITSRQINYWKGRDIIPFFDKEKKGFMNLSEALWLLIINELSNIGIDTKRLETLSKDIWIKPFNEKYADKVFEKILAENKLEELDKKTIEHYLSFEPIMVTLFRKELNPFTEALNSSLLTNRNVISFIYCPRTNEHHFNFNNIGLTSDLNNLFFGETLITIPLIPLLSKLVGIEIDKSDLDLAYLSAIENQIRRILFFDRPKFMEIAVQEDGNNRVYTITEEHKKAEELAKFFLNNKLPLGAKILIEPRAQGNFKITIKT
ncbi:hypothetical protein [Flavobacterium alvei]|uniref:hypothetical protein n=1 Tax=Flavobacterium alvei TaxID=2080416 RepID=UPI0026F2A25A|nr:hypothetical protein [Flavobacterium alvei]